MAINRYLPEKLWRAQVIAALQNSGSWTPGTDTTGLTLGRWGNQAPHATYNKIGKKVSARCYVTISNTSGAPIASWKVTGLPFTAAGSYFPAIVYYSDGALGNLSSSYVEANSTYAIFNYSVGLSTTGTGLMIFFEYEATT